MKFTGLLKKLEKYFGKDNVGYLWTDDNYLKIAIKFGQFWDCSYDICKINEQGKICEIFYDPTNLYKLQDERVYKLLKKISVIQIDVTEPNKTSYVKIYKPHIGTHEESKLEHCFIACKEKSTGEEGWYDTITSKFYRSTETLYNLNQLNTGDKDETLDR